MKRLEIWAVFWLAIAICSGETSDRVVRMKPFRVTAGFCDVYGKFRDNTENLKEVSVTWVSPRIEKQGLRVGDRLSTIDGKSVVGMSKAEFLPLLNVDMPIGEKRVFVFVRKGFFLGKAITLTFTHNAH